jgi:hypothetical protein
MRSVRLLPFLLAACSGDPGLGPALQQAADVVMAEAITFEPFEPEQARAAAQVVAAEARALGGQYVVQVGSGESLALYAKWLGAIPDDIAKLNGLDPYGKLAVGQSLKLDLGTSTAEKFEAARKGWRDGQVHAWVKQRGGVHKVEAYQIKRGDTVLGVARRNGRIPHWVMKHYNPERNLDQVAVGDTIKVPITNDRVVSQR